MLYIILVTQASCSFLMPRCCFWPTVVIISDASSDARRAINGIWYWLTVCHRPSCGSNYLHLIFPCKTSAEGHVLEKWINTTMKKITIYRLLVIHNTYFHGYNDKAHFERKKLAMMNLHSVDEFTNTLIAYTRPVAFFIVVYAMVLRRRLQWPVVYSKLWLRICMSIVTMTLSMPSTLTGCHTLHYSSQSLYKWYWCCNVLVKTAHNTILWVFIT